MTSTEINRAIAEACGWKEIRMFKGGAALGGDRLMGCLTAGNLQDVPNCVGSLDSCQQFEERFHSRYDEQQLYVMRLRDVVSRVKHSGETIDFAMLNARPDQRCEAFLKSMDLWKD